MFEGFALLFELGLFLFLQLGFVNLCQLKFPKLSVALLLVCRLLELAKCVFRLVPGLEGCVILADEGLIACHRVEGVEKKVLVAQEEILMLRMNVNEFAAHLAQHA